MENLDIFQIMVGITLLVLGRQLFWLFVAAIGMVAGFQLAQGFFAQEPYWIMLLIGAAGAVLGALLALLFQKAAVVIAGFAAGAAVTVHLMIMFGWKTIPVFPVLGGLVGAIVLYLLFDWGLIALSAMIGAGLIIQSVNWPPPQEILLYTVLTLAGILLQSMLLRRQRPDIRGPL